MTKVKEQALEITTLKARVQELEAERDEARQAATELLQAVGVARTHIIELEREVARLDGLLYHYRIKH